MQENYYVGAYWGPRQETALECARRAELFFHMLARCDPSFTQWYRAGRGAPRDLPGHPVRLEMKELEKLMLRGRHYTHVGKEVMEEMGFSQMMWNAKKEHTLISLSCGGYSPWSLNSCLLNPTRESPIHERLLCNPVMTGVLTSMATAWDPDFAMASSSEMVSLLEKKGTFAVRVGWLTYLSRRLGHLPPLPAPVRIEPLGDLGWLLILSPEPMTASNPEHVAFSARVRERLDRAGLIARPQAAPRA